MEGSDTVTLAQFCGTLLRPCFNNDCLQTADMRVVWIGSARDRVGLDEHISGEADRVMTSEALTSEMKKVMDYVDDAIRRTVDSSTARPLRGTITIHRGRSVRRTWDLMSAEMRARDETFRILSDLGSPPSSSDAKDAWVEMEVDYRGVRFEIIFGVRGLHGIESRYTSGSLNIAFGTAGIFVSTDPQDRAIRTGDLIFPRNLYLLHDDRGDDATPIEVTLEKTFADYPHVEGAKAVDLVAYRSCAIFRPECLQRLVRPPKNG